MQSCIAGSRELFEKPLMVFQTIDATVTLVTSHTFPRREGSPEGLDQ